MQQKQTNKIITAALMMAMITVMILILPIPLPAVNGYINLGDSIIFMAVIILGWKYGAAAGGLGGALADLILGYAAWAPFTFLIKGGMALIMGLIIEKSKRKGKGICFLGMICGGIWMVLGYFVAGGILYGNFLASALNMPMDGLQVTIGAVLATVILTALEKTPMRKYFTYSFSAGEKTE